MVIPEHVCTKTPYGVAVDLTQQAHYTLTDTLVGAERFFIRIHSHPGKAFHSKRDDANAIITHQGAVSIVVPDFADRPITLTECAMYRLEHGRGWIPLMVHEVQEAFKVVA